MKLNYLFAHRFKKIGLFIMIPSLLLGLFVFITDYEPEFLDIHVFGLFEKNEAGTTQIVASLEDNILNELCGVLVIISSMLVAFSKEESEDEYISKIRLESLVWAVYFNATVLLVSFLFVFGIMFYSVMVFNIFTTLLFFIIRFNWQLSRLRNSLNNE